MVTSKAAKQLLKSSKVIKPSRVGSNENLKAIGERLGLEPCMVKNDSQGDSKLVLYKTKLMSDMIEAILGAVYLDVEPVDRMRNISNVMRNIGLL